MDDLFYILIIAGVSLGVGLFLGLLIGQLRKPSVKDSAQQKISDTDFKPIVEIGRHRKSKEIIIQMGEETYRNYSDLRVGDRESLIDAYGDLQSWMGILPDELKPVSIIPEPLMVEPSVSAFLTHRQPNKKSMSPSDVVAKALQSDVGDPDSVPVSIAAQIDEILQEIVIKTPLINRGIRLMELPDQGMVVMVGLDKFEGVDAVTDPEVKAVLKQAVAAWEAKYAEE